MTRFLDKKMTFLPPKVKKPKLDYPFPCDHKGFGKILVGRSKWKCLRCERVVK